MLISLWFFTAKILAIPGFKLIKINPTKNNFSQFSFLKKLYIIYFSPAETFDANHLRKKYSATSHYFHTLKNSHYYDLHFFHAFKLKPFHHLVNLSNEPLKKDTFLGVYLSLLLLRKHTFQYFYLYFKNFKYKNLLKVSFISILILKKSNFKYSLNILNLTKVNDWYKYNFDIKNYFFLKKFFKKIPSLITLNYKVYGFYKGFFKKISTKLNLNYDNNLSFLTFYLNKFNYTKVNLNKMLATKLANFYPTKFNESSTNKFIDLNKVDEYLFLFLRKNRIFNKGRYSRNRQTYRTGVYWCLWFNIVSVYGLYFIFYRFTFNFGYLWIALIIFFGSFLFSRILKYNFIKYNFVISEFSNLINWYSFFFKNIFEFTLKKLSFFFKNLINFINLNFLLNLNFSVFFNNCINALFNFFKSVRTKEDSSQFYFIWKNLNKHDDSFLKTQILNNYLNQLGLIFFK